MHNFASATASFRRRGATFQRPATGIPPGSALPAAADGLGAKHSAAGKDQQHPDFLLPYLEQTGLYCCTLFMDRRGRDRTAAMAGPKTTTPSATPPRTKLGTGIRPIPTGHRRPCTSVPPTARTRQTASMSGRRTVITRTALAREIMLPTSRRWGIFSRVSRRRIPNARWPISRTAPRTPWSLPSLRRLPAAFQRRQRPDGLAGHDSQPGLRSFFATNNTSGNPLDFSAPGQPQSRHPHRDIGACNAESTQSAHLGG